MRLVRMDCHSPRRGYRLECKLCKHRVMLTRRELARRLKINLTKREDKKNEQQDP